MPEPEICSKCKRPRNTAADLERWKSEFPDRGVAHKDPEWATQLCWTINPSFCHRKPIAST